MEYVDQENLLVKFGGNDPWTYDFEAESERMRQEVDLRIYTCIRVHGGKPVRKLA